MKYSVIENENHNSNSKIISAAPVSVMPQKYMTYECTDSISQFMMQNSDHCNNKTPYNYKRKIGSLRGK